MEQVPARGVTVRSGAVALVVALVLGVVGSVMVGSPAGADITKSYANTASIGIPDSGSANPFPSTINVSGAGAEVTGVKVVIKNTTHGCAKDLDVLLVGPTGAKTTLFSDNGHAALLPSCSDLTKNSITIDDTCSDFSNAVPSGADICVRPSDNDSLGHQGDSWPGVGDEFGHPLLSTAFGATNPNGAWKLYVVDDSGDDSGSFAGGWELKITTKNTAPQATPQVIDVNKGTAAPFTLAGTDPEGDTLSCVVPAVTVSAKGVLGGSGCNRTFTANPRATGSDSIAFKVKDSQYESPSATAVFNIVNRPPTATDQTITVGRNERVALSLGGTDPDPGESLALTCNPTLGSTALGKVSGSGCNVTYAANNVNGPDSFNFLVSDGFGGLETGTITITVADPVLPGCTTSDTKNARYICRVYLDLLGRAADPGGKAFWLRKVDAGQSRTGIIQKYQTTPEYARRVVDNVYKTFLKRNPDSGGQTFWANKIRKGANPDEIRTQVIGSSEYFTKSGGSAEGFAAAIYQQVTRTPATTAQINTVKSQIAAGKTRTSIAAALLATRAGDTATVQGIYETYLRRTPPGSEVTSWVNKLQAGTTELKIVLFVVSSNEYYNRS